MKRYILSVMVIAIFAISCTSTPPSAPSANNSNVAGSPSYASNDIPEKEWKLIEVYVDERNTGFNRSSLNSNVPEMYTLSFSEGTVSGAGAPNRYAAPYTAGENKTINIALIRATLMASIVEPASLREYDFFNYLQSVYKWNVINENLELYSKLENGSEIRLVFSL